MLDIVCVCVCCWGDVFLLMYIPSLISHNSVSVT